MPTKYEIVHSQTYPMAILQLEAEESMRVEPGAMVGMSPNVELGSESPGGLMALIQKQPDQPQRRNRFQTLYTARGGPGSLSLAPSFPGQIYAMDLDNHELLVQSFCFLACSTALEVNEEVAGGGMFFSKEGRREDQYLVRVRGTGLILLSTYGAAHLMTLPPGERYIADSSHVVAFESRIPHQVHEATDKIWLRLASAEGLVAEFEGPGDILLQTRNLSTFAENLKAFL